MLEIKRKDLTTTDCNEELENVCISLYAYKRKNVEAFYDFEGTKIYSM